MHLTEVKGVESTPGRLHACSASCPPSSLFWSSFTLPFACRFSKESRFKATAGACLLFQLRESQSRKILSSRPAWDVYVSRSYLEKHCLALSATVTKKSRGTKDFALILLYPNVHRILGLSGERTGPLGIQGPVFLRGVKPWCLGTHCSWLYTSGIVHVCLDSFPGRHQLPPAPHAHNNVLIGACTVMELTPNCSMNLFCQHS